MSSGNTTVPNIDRRRLAELRAAEDADFIQRSPTSATWRARARSHLPNGVPMTWMAGLYRTPPIYIDRGSGAAVTDVDGNDYLDFNVCDLSMTIGFGNEVIAAALARQARRGVHFPLPGEDSIVVAELLAQRVGTPHWQFTHSATGAIEVIRDARLITGRHKVVIFGGTITVTWTRRWYARSTDASCPMRRACRPTRPLTRSFLRSTIWAL